MTNKQPTIIDLYEDNAGQLTLVCESLDLAVTCLEQLEEQGGFARDCQAIVDGDVSQWTLPMFAMDEVDLMHDELAAQWIDGEVTVNRSAGIAARRYVGTEVE